MAASRREALPARAPPRALRRWPKQPLISLIRVGLVRLLHIAKALQLRLLIGFAALRFGATRTQGAHLACLPRLPPSARAGPRVWQLVHQKAARQTHGQRQETDSKETETDAVKSSSSSWSGGSLLPAACCLLPAACCMGLLLPAACCLLPAACCLRLLQERKEAEEGSQHKKYMQFILLFREKAATARP